MKDAVKTNASKYGLIAAAIGIAYTLIAYLANLELLVNPFAGIALWVVTLVILILSVGNTKKDFGGFISFRDAFSVFVLAYIINALVSTVFSILLFAVVDPGAAEDLTEMTVERSVELMERFGAPEEQIEDAVTSMEQGDQFSIGNQIRTFFWGIIIYAIIGLIVAAIMKKDKPEYEDQVDTQTE